MTRKIRTSAGISIFRKLRQLWRLVRESHAGPLAGQHTVPPAAAAGETAITFIGHSSFLIQTAGLALLIDPVFATRLILLRRQRRPGVRMEDLPAIDAVLLTHAHMDHLNRPSLRAITREMRRRGLPAPIAIVPTHVSDLVRGLGFSTIHELACWQSFNLTTEACHLDRSAQTPLNSVISTEAKRSGETPVFASRPASHSDAPATEGFFSDPWSLVPDPCLTITATPAQHWGARLFSDTHRGFGGYTLAAPDTPTIYHSGDTAYFNGFHEIAARLHPKIALLPIGAYYPDSYRRVHTSPEEALQAFKDLRAHTMVPMHYNTFRLGREPMNEPLPRLLAAADRAGIRSAIHPLAEGETLSTNDHGITVGPPTTVGAPLIAQPSARWVGPDSAGTLITNP